MDVRYRDRIVWIIVFLLIGASILVLLPGMRASASTEELTPLQRTTPTRSRTPTATPKPTATPVPVFQMDVDSVICVRGHGPVAIGTVQQGIIIPGESVLIDHPGLSDSVVVDAIQTFWGAKTAVPGQTAGLLLRLSPSSVEAAGLAAGNFTLEGRSLQTATSTASLADEPFTMMISGVGSDKGKSTLVSGIIESGTVKTGQEVQVLRPVRKRAGEQPAEESLLSATVTGIENLSYPKGSATVCDQVALQLEGVSASDLQDAFIVQQDVGVLPFRLTVQDVFSIKGRGTVVTGQVERGALRPMQSIVIRQDGKPDIKTVVTAIEMFNKSLDKAGPGDNVGLLLRGISKDDIRSGAVVEGLAD